MMVPHGSADIAVGQVREDLYIQYYRYVISTVRTFSYCQMSTTLIVRSCIAKTEHLDKFINFYSCVPTNYGLLVKILKSCDQP